MSKSQKLHAYQFKGIVYVAAQAIKDFDQMTANEAASCSLLTIDVDKGEIIHSREGPTTSDRSRVSNFDQMDEEDLAGFQRALHVEIAFRRIHKHVDEELRGAGGAGLCELRPAFRSSALGEFFMTCARNNIGVTIGRLIP